MKKYMIMALMPFIFSSELQAKNRFADVDFVLMQEYENACQAINSSARYHFDSVLHVLKHHASNHKGNEREIALGHIIAIQKLLQNYRASEIQKLSYYSWAVGSNQTIITGQIDPALKRISKALKDLKVSQSEYSFALKATGVILAAVVAGFAYKTVFLTPKKAIGSQEYQEACRIVEIFKNENPNFKPDLVAQARKLKGESDIRAFYGKDQDHAKAALIGAHFYICEHKDLIDAVAVAGLSQSKPAASSLQETLLLEPQVQVTYDEACRIVEKFKNENPNFNIDLVTQAQALETEQAIRTFYRKDQDHAKAALIGAHFYICEQNDLIDAVLSAGLGKDYLTE